MVVYLGTEDCINYEYPMDCEYSFNDRDFEGYEDFEKILNRIAYENAVAVDKITNFKYTKIPGVIDGKVIRDFLSEKGDGKHNRETIRMVSAEDFNRIEGTDYALKENEVVVFKSNEDAEVDKILLQGLEFTVKDEYVHNLQTESKERKSLGSIVIYVVFKDSGIINDIIGRYGKIEVNTTINRVDFNIKGEKADKEIFEQQLEEAARKMAGFNMVDSKSENESEIKTMYGGLLFIGIVFGLVFTISLLMMMYYKQITEGYEDKDSFLIMKKVGMGDREIRKTIVRQILLVFFIPLMVAVIHTFVAIHVVRLFMLTLDIFNDRMINLAAAGVIFVFIIVYIISYTATSRAYYRIVR